MSNTDDFSTIKWPSDVVSSVSPNDVFSRGGFDPENALAMLLLNGVCSLPDSRPDEPQKPGGGHFPLYVNCSDIFQWGCTDCEPLP